jgi:MoxR-like ATPase
MNEKNSEIPLLVEEIEKEVSKVVIGQKKAIRTMIVALLCNGHTLLEGVPGIAKTLILKTLSEVFGCDMKRVQFTVDLLPTDIIGIVSYDPKKGFEVVKGPVFTNFLLADEINRSPPKTQGSLLEAMQERAVTIGRETYKLPVPFFVLATQNPLEQSGVYSLPEAQVDRFLFKIIIDYPTMDEEVKVLSNNTSVSSFDEYKLRKILSPEKIIELQKRVKEVYTSEKVKDYIIKIVNETRNKNSEFSKYISYGASPRASISLYIASKAEALINGRDYVTPSDVKEIAFSVLRHRIILNYEAEAEKISSDEIVRQILAKVEVP